MKKFDKLQKIQNIQIRCLELWLGNRKVAVFFDEDVANSCYDHLKQSRGATVARNYAIRFAEWIIENRYYVYGDDSKGITWKINGQPKISTTEELIAKFDLETNKNQ